MTWHIAALSRSKKLPNLDRLMVRARSRAKQTWQDIKAAFLAINATAGGVVKKKGDPE